MNKWISATSLLLALFSAAASQAQSTGEKYIEVTVSDTVFLAPDEIIYSMRVKDNTPVEYPIYDDNSNNTDYLNDMKRMEEEAKFRREAQLKKLKEFLTKEKVSWKEGTSNEIRSGYIYMDMEDYHHEEALLITFKSLKELSAFIEKIPKDIEYYGNIAGMRCTRTEKFENALLDKIIKRAKTQAEKIASVSKVTLGGLTQYSDNINEIAKSVQEIILSFMRESRRAQDFQYKNMVLTKTARVRFAIQ